MTIFDQISEEKRYLVNAITETKQSLLPIINENLETLKQLKIQITESLKVYIDQTNRVIHNQIIYLTEEGKNYLDKTIDQAESLSNNWQDKIDLLLNHLFTDWLPEHPLSDWLLTYPIISMIIILGCFILIFSLWRMIIKLIKQIIVAILRTPWLISKFFFLKSVNQYSEQNYYLKNQNNILQRLKAIEQKQEAILEQLTNFNSQK